MVLPRLGRATRKRNGREWNGRLVSKQPARGRWPRNAQGLGPGRGGGGNGEEQKVAYVSMLMYIRCFSFLNGVRLLGAGETLLCIGKVEGLPDSLIICVRCESLFWGSALDGVALWQMAYVPPPHK